jgi:DNA polymerase delta subunit 3
VGHRQEVAEACHRMLYEFHQTQYSKKPGSVHATYLLDGNAVATKETPVNEHQQHGEDVHMESSPYVSSSMPQAEQKEDGVPQTNIILVREEDLQGKMNIWSVRFVYKWGQATADGSILAAKARFERIHSIHIYSLGPSSVQVVQSHQ